MTGAVLNVMLYIYRTEEEAVEYGDGDRAPSPRYDDCSYTVGGVLL